MKEKVKLSFWATRCFKKWKNKDMKKLYKNLLKLEDELTRIREKIFEDYTE